MKPRAALLLSALAVPPAQAVDAEFGVVGESGPYRYEEPGVMRLDGALSGVRLHGRLDFGHAGGEGTALLGDLRLAFGTADYRSEQTGNSEDEPNGLAELRVMVGTRLPSGALRLTPYGGLGTRYLINDSSGTVTDTGYYGYRRESQYVYVPLGVELAAWPVGRLRLLASAEYDLFVAGRQRSHLAEGAVLNRQTGGWGARGRVEIGYAGFRLAAYHQRWSIADSAAAEGYIEPANLTRESGLAFGYAW